MQSVFTQKNEFDKKYDKAILDLKTKGKDQIIKAFTEEIKSRKSKFESPNHTSRLKIFIQDKIKFEDLIYLLEVKNFKLTNSEFEAIFKKELENKAYKDELLSSSAFTDVLSKIKTKFNNNNEPSLLVESFEELKKANIKKYLNLVAEVERDFVNGTRGGLKNKTYSENEKQVAENNLNSFLKKDLTDEEFEKITEDFPFLNNLPIFDEKNISEIKSSVFHPYSSVNIADYYFKIAANRNNEMYFPDLNLVKHLNGLFFEKKRYEKSFGGYQDISTEGITDKLELFKKHLEVIKYTFENSETDSINILDNKNKDEKSSLKFFEIPASTEDGKNKSTEVNLYLPEILNEQMEEELSSFILQNKELFSQKCNNLRYRSIATAAINLENENKEVQRSQPKNFKELFSSLFDFKYLEMIKNPNNFGSILLKEPKDGLGLRYFLEAAIENQNSYINSLEIRLDKDNNLEEELSKLIKKQEDGLITKNNIPIKKIKINYESLSLQFSEKDKSKLEDILKNLSSLGFKEIELNINVPGFDKLADLNTFIEGLKLRSLISVSFFDEVKISPNKLNTKKDNENEIKTEISAFEKVEDNLFKNESAIQHRGKEELDKELKRIKSKNQNEKNQEINSVYESKLEIDHNQEQEEEEEEEQEEEEEEQEASTAIKEEDLITRENFFEKKEDVIPNYNGAENEFYFKRLYDKIVGQDLNLDIFNFEKKITSITTKTAAIFLKNRDIFNGYFSKNALPQGFYFIKNGDKLILDYDARRVSLNQRYNLRPRFTQLTYGDLNNLTLEGGDSDFFENKIPVNLKDYFFSKANNIYRYRNAIYDGFKNELNFLEKLNNNSEIEFLEKLLKKNQKLETNYRTLQSFISFKNELIKRNLKIKNLDFTRLNLQDVDSSAFLFRILDILDVIKKRDKTFDTKEQQELLDNCLIGGFDLIKDTGPYYAVKYQNFNRIYPSMFIGQDFIKDNKLDYSLSLIDLQDTISKTNNQNEIEGLIFRHLLTENKEGESKLNLDYKNFKNLISEFSKKKDLNGANVNYGNFLKLLVKFPVIEDLKSLAEKIQNVSLDANFFKLLSQIDNSNLNFSYDDILNILSLNDYRRIEQILTHKKVKDGAIDSGVLKIFFHNLSMMNKVIKPEATRKDFIDRKFGDVFAMLHADKDNIEDGILLYSFVIKRYEGLKEIEGKENKLKELFHKRLNENNIKTQADLIQNLKDVIDIKNKDKLVDLNAVEGDFQFFNIAKIKRESSSSEVIEYKINFVNRFNLKGKMLSYSEKRKLEDLCNILYKYHENNNKKSDNLLKAVKEIYNHDPKRVKDILNFIINDTDLKKEDKINQIANFYNRVKPLTFDKDLFLVFCNRFKDKPNTDLEFINFKNTYNYKYLNHEQKLKAVQEGSYIDNCITRIKKIEEILKVNKVRKNGEIFKEYLNKLSKLKNEDQKIYLDFLSLFDNEKFKGKVGNELFLELLELLNKNFGKTINLNGNDVLFSRVFYVKTNLFNASKDIIKFEGSEDEKVILKGTLLNGDFDINYYKDLISFIKNRSIKEEAKGAFLGLFYGNKLESNKELISNIIKEFKEKITEEPELPQLNNGRVITEDLFSFVKCNFKSIKNNNINILEDLIKNKKQSLYYEELKYFNLNGLFYTLDKEWYTLGKFLKEKQNSDKDITVEYLIDNYETKTSLKTAINGIIRNDGIFQDKNGLEPIQKVLKYQEDKARFEENQKNINKDIVSKIENFQKDNGGKRTSDQRNSLDKISYLNLLKKLHYRKNDKSENSLRKEINAISAISGKVSNYSNFKIKKEIDRCSKILQSNNSARDVKSAAKTELLAILFEAYYRTYEKYPDLLQISSIILGIDGKRNLEISTGQGKTIIAGLTAAFKALSNSSVFVTSSTSDLARAGLSENKDFYNFVGIKTANTLSSSNLNKAKKDLKEKPCIFYTTPADAFFFLESIRYDRCEKDRKRIGKDLKVFTLLDEVDTSIDSASTILQATCSAGIDDESEIINDVVGFVNEFYSKFKSTKPQNKLKSIFNSSFAKSKNTDENNIQESIQDLVNNSEEIESSKIVDTLIKFIPKDTYGKFAKIFNNNKDLAKDQLALIISAVIKTDRLEPDIDYAVIDTSFNENGIKVKRKIVKIISKSTGELVGGKWGDYLHIALTKKLEKQNKELFVLENQANTYTKGSIAQLLEYSDSYLGVSGTLGGREELSFGNVEAIQIPVSKPFQREDEIPLFFKDIEDPQGKGKPITGQEQLLDKLSAILKTRPQDKNKKQPALVIVDNIKEGEKIFDYVKKLLGNDKGVIFITGKETEEERLKLIDKSMEEGKIVIGTGLVGRGTDWKPDHKDGLMIVNLAKDITYREYIQILGRSGRRGAIGKTYTLIVNDKIAKDIEEGRENAFSAIENFYRENSKKVVEIASKKRSNSGSFDKLTNYYFSIVNQIVEHNTKLDAESYGILIENSKMIFAKFQTDYKDQLFKDEKFEYLSDLISNRLLKQLIFKQSYNSQDKKKIIQDIKNKAKEEIKNFSLKQENLDFETDEVRNKVDFENILFVSDEPIAIYISNDVESTNEKGESIKIISNKEILIPSLRDDKNLTKEEAFFIAYGNFLKNYEVIEDKTIDTQLQNEVFSFEVLAEYLNPLQVFSEDEFKNSPKGAILENPPVGSGTIITFKTKEDKENFINQNKNVRTELKIKEEIKIKLPIKFRKKNSIDQDVKILNETYLNNFLNAYNNDETFNKEEYQDLLPWEYFQFNKSEVDKKLGFKNYFDNKENFNNLIRAGFTDIYKRVYENKLKENTTKYNNNLQIKAKEQKDVDIFLYEKNKDKNLKNDIRLKNLLKFLEDNQAILTQGGLFFKHEGYNKFSLDLLPNLTQNQKEDSKKHLNKLIQQISKEINPKRLSYEGGKCTFILNLEDRIKFNDLIRKIAKDLISKKLKNEDIQRSLLEQKEINKTKFEVKIPDKSIISRKSIIKNDDLFSENESHKEEDKPESHISESNISEKIEHFPYNESDENGLKDNKSKKSENRKKIKYTDELYLSKEDFDSRERNDKKEESLNLKTIQINKKDKKEELISKSQMLIIASIVIVILSIVGALFYSQGMNNNQNNLLLNNNTNNSNNSNDGLLNLNIVNKDDYLKI